MMLLPFVSVVHACQEECPPGGLDEGRDLEGGPHVEGCGGHGGGVPVTLLVPPKNHSNFFGLAEKLTAS